MKKWIVILVILLLVLIKLGEHRTDFKEEEKAQLQTKSIPVKEVQIHQGDLRLIDKTYSVAPEGIASDIILLKDHAALTSGYTLLEQDIRLSKRVAKAFQRMVQAAEKDGVTHFLISSGYRDFKEQAALYQEKGAAYALPAGYSEHNSGLSLDIGSSSDKMERAPEGKWLRDHAADYGFILRYPPAKKAITGIEYEPWHFRYVGLPHSQIMQEKRMTLEEYLEYLKEEKQVSFILNGKHYQIHYNVYAPDQKIPVPENRKYQISGNNVDGVIVTTYP